MSYKNPLVSVVMPVFNSQEYLSKAIESILNQTYENFELIIINDGSVDYSDLIISNFLFDKRIRYIKRENLGLIYTLNEGISLSKGKYVARMDSDDISHEDRLKKQILFMENHSDIAVLGTSSFIMDQNGCIVGERNPPKTPYMNKILSFFGPTLTHPCVVFNKYLLGNDLYYNREAVLVEDYELWLRLMENGYKLANMKEKLFFYRINQEGVSEKNKITQKNNAAVLCRNVFFKGNFSTKLLDSLKVIHLREYKSKFVFLSSFFYILKLSPISLNFFIRSLYVLRCMFK
ncbi:glycosyltransferase family 2 protein [Acinetobacter ursingii]|uniref:glycosyltransferase family 2 protein n=1 Tax=Acinetobacter ursingii TaxID=108980 RepID=UPI00300ACD94